MVLRTEIESIKKESQKALDDVRMILNNTQMAGVQFDRAREQILQEMRAKAAGVITITTETVVVAARDRPRLWGVGAALAVWFLDGKEEEKEEVMKFANEWSKEGNISFARSANAEKSDIRVSFLGEGNWSFVGTDAKNVPNGHATITLGGLVGADETTRRAIVLHEFGHALGFFHENQNPKAKIRWNVAGIQSELGLSKTVIEENYTKTYKKELSPCDREFDPGSIMMVAIPASFTLDKRAYAMPLDLSASDKACIRKMYPK